MGGVDLSDKIIYHYAAERATHRYWRKIFNNLVDISLLNAYELYKRNTDDSQILSRHKFMVSVVESLCSTESEDLPLQVISNTDQHGFMQLPDHKERDCEVCGKDRSKARHRYCTGQPTTTTCSHNYYSVLLVMVVKCQHNLGHCRAN